jgi:formyltetrahydrofolate synthetase
MTTASNFNIVVKTVSPEYYPLSAHNLSSSFFMGAKTHQNEQANFLDNVRKGCANLARHVQNASDEVCPTLLEQILPGTGQRV